jgi:ELWxxDGT repeat protein
LFFLADDGSNGEELWRSDGTAAGTFMVKDICNGSNGSYSFGLTVVGNMLYFISDDGFNGKELWRSDGTTTGTVLVKDINAGVTDGFYYTSEIVAVGANLYFNADNGVNGFELWKSDGTTAGTVMVKDIWIGGNSSAPSNLVVLGDSLYFQYKPNPYIGGMLWKSDGTEAGTFQVSELNAFNHPSQISDMTVVGNTLYFQATYGSNDVELWKSDGTDAGTIVVRDNYGGTGSPQSSFLFPMGNTLYFVANDGINGEELYVYTMLDPRVSVLAVTNASPTGATLNGMVNPNGSTTTAQFEYGTTTAYGSTVAVTISPNNDSVNHSVSSTLTGLIPNTLYHFRLKATNAEGSAYTSDGTFVAALSSEARLSNLTLSSGTLSPNFGSNSTSYTAMVTNSITSLTATPTVLESHASVTVNSATVASGTASAPINLALGSNVITVLGAAQNGVNTQSYTINVTRQTPYQTWIDSATSGSGSLPTGDFENDGLANLLEYAFGTNPSESSPGAMAVINPTTISPGTPKVMEDGGMKALFIRRKDWAASGLTYTVQFSPNLTLWENSVAVPTVIADDGNLQAVTVPFPALINGEPARFFRVQVNGQ